MQIDMRTATLNGVRHSYFDIGKGVPLVLLHGWPEHSYGWRKLAVRLARSHRVIALDFRGCGDSETVASGFDKKTLASDAASLIRHLGLERAIVVGHDWGGPIAYRVALDHPALVAGLVILNGRMPLLTRHTELMYTPQQVPERWYFFFNLVPDLPEKVIGRSLEDYFRYLTTHWSGSKPSHDTQDVAEYLRVNQRPNGLRAGLGYYRAAVGQDVADWKALAGSVIRVPSLILWGAKDPVLPPIYIEGVETVTPDLEVHIHKEAGHFIPSEEPDWCAEHINVFLAKRFANWPAASQR